MGPTQQMTTWTGRAIASGAAIVAVALATPVMKLASLNATTAGLLYLLVVLALSSWRGLVAGTAASVAATLLFNFFFLPPFGTMTIADPANWVALASFLGGSLIASRLLVRAQRQAEEKESSRQELATLYELSVDLFAATNRVGALEEAAGRALLSVGAASGGLVMFNGSPNRQRTVVWIGEKQTDEVEDMVAGVGRHRRSVEIPSRFGRDVYLPLMIGGRAVGALAVRGTKATTTVLESVASLVALAVERERFIAELTHVEALRESDQLKTSVLRAVSHDLNSPLTAISLELAAARKLVRDGEASPHLDTLAIHVAQLQRRISNLLSMARLEAGKTVPHPEPTPAADLFRSARESLPLIRDRRRFVVRVAHDCPDVFTDPSLALEVLVNLVENADRASPPDEVIELEAVRSPASSDMVRLEVLDRGPGVGAVRGRANARDDDSNRRGLGIEIVQNLVRVNKGTFALVDRPGGGAIARVEFPAAKTPDDAAEASG